MCDCIHQKANDMCAGPCRLARSVALIMGLYAIISGGHAMRPLAELCRRNISPMRLQSPSVLATAIDSKIFHETAIDSTGWSNQS